ncbi:hypothetical protein AAY473_037666 [Plecturocebus cupreus]
MLQLMLRKEACRREGVSLLLPKLKCNGVISVHCNLCLLS